MRYNALERTGASPCHCCRRSVTPSPPQRDAPPPPPPSASMMDSPAFGGGLLFVDPSAPTQTGQHWRLSLITAHLLVIHTHVAGGAAGASSCDRHQLRSPSLWRTQPGTNKTLLPPVPSHC